MRRTRNQAAIERSQVAKRAKPLGEIIGMAIKAKSEGATDPLGVVVPPVPRVRPQRRRGRKKAVREASVLHDCLRWLHCRGVFAWRNNSGTLWANGQPVTFGHPGSPDILGILPDGRFLGVECKSPTGRQSEKQKKFQEKIEANHGVYILARSEEDLERQWPK